MIVTAWVWGGHVRVRVRVRLVLGLRYGLWLWFSYDLGYVGDAEQQAGGIGTIRAQTMYPNCDPNYNPSLSTSPSPDTI